MKCDFLVFGASGMQGHIVVRDLIESGFSVFASCHSPEELEKILSAYPGIKGETADISDNARTQELIRTAGPRVVINCAEGDWNLGVFQSALAAGAHVIDLGSSIAMTKSQLEMHDDFARKDLCAITGCGSTPGINNVGLARALRELDEVHTVEAGFAWTSNIKKFVVPFSMASILEEFTEPATLIENGVWKEKLPLETVETRTFRAIGTQKCLLVPHPEVYTFYLGWKQKGLNTIRYFGGFPDHSFDVINALAQRMDDNGGVDVPGEGVVPVESLTKLLQRLYPRPEGYTEQENLWVTADGISGGQPRRVTMECIVPTLSGWEDAGCNIDTAFPASAIAQMILDGGITARGSFEPGPVVPAEPFFQRMVKKSMEFYLDGTRIA